MLPLINPFFVSDINYFLDRYKYENKKNTNLMKNFFKNDLDTNLSSFAIQDEKYVMTCKLSPKATSKNVNITIENNVITIEYEYSTENFKESFSTFETLPERFDKENLKATVVNGLLEISAPILPEIEETIEETIEEAKDEDNINVNINFK